MALHFAMNRTCAPQLTLGGFMDLTRRAGISAVEIRNDLPGQEFSNGIPAAELGQRLAGNGLKIASVNALQRFNDWTPDRAAEARHLVSYTAALGAPGLVLCPLHEAGHGWVDADAERNLRDGLRHLAPILRAHGVTGFVEPLGMPHSTMKRQAMAVEAISDVDGWDCYRLCFDTFQSFRCSDTKLFPDRIGLIHVSGIARADLPRHALLEPDRGLVFRDDRSGCIDLLKTMLAAGYAGHVSMEPFSPQVQQDPNLGARLGTSFDYLASALGQPR